MGVRGVVEVSEPDEGDVGTDEPRRPGVAKAVRGSRLVGQGKRSAASLQVVSGIGEHRAHDPGGFAREKRHGRRLRIVGKETGLRHAPARVERRVEFRDVQGGDFGAAEHDREPVVFAREGKLYVRPQKEIVEVGRNPSSKIDCGDVSAHPQSLRGADGPFEAPVRVFGFVSRKAPRRVKENRLRVNETLIERQAVDEGLQGGPRTSRGDEAVHLSFDRVAEVVGAPHFGENFARTGVEKHDRAVPNAVGRKAREVRAECLAHALLQSRVDGDAQRRLVEMPPVGERPVGCVGRQEGKALLRKTYGGFERPLFQGREVGVFQKTRREARVRGPEGFGSGASCDRVLRHDRQRSGFRGGKLASRLAKVHETRRADPRNVAAPGKKVEVGLENFRLFVVRFVAKRPEDLPEFSRNRSRMKPEAHARRLHRDGRGADRT